MDIWPFISDSRIQLCSEISQNKLSGIISKRVLSKYSSGLYCNTVYTPRACDQGSMSDYNCVKQSGVPGQNIGFGSRGKVGWLQPPQLWLGTGIYWVALVLVSRDTDLRHIQLHPTCSVQLPGWTFTKGFKTASWTFVRGNMPWSRVYFASWSTLSFPSMPQWLGFQKRMWVPFIAQ